MIRLSKTLNSSIITIFQDIRLSFKEHKEKYLEEKKRCFEEYELDCNKSLAARHDAGSKCCVMFSPTSPTEAEKVKVKSQDCHYQSDSDTSDECNDINPLHSHKKLVGNLSGVLPSDVVYQSIKSEPPIDPYFSHVVTGFVQTNRLQLVPSPKVTWEGNTISPEVIWGDPISLVAVSQQLHSKGDPTSLVAIGQQLHSIGNYINLIVNSPKSCIRNILM